VKHATMNGFISGIELDADSKVEFWKAVQKQSWYDCHTPKKPKLELRSSAKESIGICGDQH
jgi:hypothetical protein